MDVFSKEKRSEVMSRIKGRDTRLEIKVRSRLFKDGYRFRKNDKRYPGKPDILLPKYKTVIQINGCFWHGHSNCKNGHTPRKNTGFWIDKLNKNMERDRKNLERLTALGYKVFIIWECEIQTLRGLDSKLLPIYQIYYFSFPILDS